MHDSITDIPGIRVGHYTNLDGATGCTVVLCTEGAVGGVDVRGSAPGTRETDLLRPMNLVQEAHAVLLSGGSAYGLNAAAGVMEYLEEHGVGFSIGPAVVPIVPAAILFDLGLVTHTARPGPDAGYRACVDANSGPVPQGTVGAGTGATVGKALGQGRATKGGIGAASVELAGGAIVSALVAVNAFGGVVDPETGEVLAGPRTESGDGFEDSEELLVRGLVPERAAPIATNTTIGVVATNARLTKEQANKLALHAQDGLAQAVRPSHAMGDGDVFFALATGGSDADVSMNRLGAAAARAVSRAIVNAVTHATGLGGVPARAEVVGGRHGRTGDTRVTR